MTEKTATPKTPAQLLAEATKLHRLQISLCSLGEYEASMRAGQRAQAIYQSLLAPPK